VRTYKTEGIIIKRTNFGEADKILTIFSSRYGKIKTLAKGVRRLTSRRAGSLELFNFVTIFLAVGKNFDIITEAEAKEVFRGKRQETVWAVYYLAEIIDKLCPERQKNQKVLDLLRKTIRALEKNPDEKEMKAIIENFREALLFELGYLGNGKRPESLERYMEGIIEKELKSKKFLSL